MLRTFNESPFLDKFEKKEHEKPFGASPKIKKRATGLNKEKQAFLDQLIASLVSDAFSHQ